MRPRAIPLAMILLATTTLITACGSSQKPEPLSSPVESGRPPLLVPAEAELIDARPKGTGWTYRLPSGVSQQDVVDWYRKEMPPEQNVGEFDYAGRQTDLPDGRPVVWTYCDDGLGWDLAIDRDSSIDGGNVTIVINITFPSIDYPCPV